MRPLILGGGVIGTSIAYRLAVRGADVTRRPGRRPAHDAAEGGHAAVTPVAAEIVCEFSMQREAAAGEVHQRGPVAPVHRQKSARLATAEIGRRLGVSKNAVVGKAHRLDLPARRRRSGEARRARNRSRRGSDRCPSSPTSCPCQPLRLLSRRCRPCCDGTERPPAATGFAPCCWPIGDPGTPGFRFCGQFAVIGKPYCGEHCRDAYRRPTQREQPADDAAVGR